jgi:signal transduction histidine kinase
MADLMDQTIQNVQRISSELRPEVLDVLGLSEAIEWHAQEFQKRTGIRCDLNLSFRDIDFEPDLGTALFRILQETLTNVARHAKASKIAIKFCEDNGNMVLQIADNGKGISESQISDPKSLGLLGMKERALLWDGEVQIRGSQGQGTTITVRIPRG